MRSRRPRIAAAALAGLTGALLGGGGGFGAACSSASPADPPPRRALSISVPPDRDLLDVAVSPDGRSLAYTAIRDGRVRLYVRPVDRFEATALPGTEGAAQPFFSPDGATIGFFADGWLRTTPVDPDAAIGPDAAADSTGATNPDTADGPADPERAASARAERDPDAATDPTATDPTSATDPASATAPDPGAAVVAVCRVPGEPAGGTWSPDGRIIFGGPGAAGLLAVPAQGGEPAALTAVDAPAGETAHGWPQAIDGRRLLYTVGRRGRDPRLRLLDLETGATRPLPLADGGGAFVAPDTVVFARRGEIFAATIGIDPDGADGSARPAPRPVERGAASSAVGDRGLGRARLGAARDGTLVFVPAPATGDTRIVRVDRTGQATPLDGAAARHQTPRIAPDGRRAAFSAVTAFLRRDLWLLDLESGARRPLTANAGDNHSPVWAPDGATLTFASSRTGPQRLFRLRPDGRADPEPLTGGDQRTPGSWSPDGRRLAFHERQPDRGRDLWIWTAGPDGAADTGRGAAPWLATAANERAPAFSPDGRWIAYVSDHEPGRGDQVYIRRADAAADRNGGLAPTRITPAGGTEPVWERSGAALVYRRGRGVYRVAIGANGAPAGPAAHLFDGVFIRDPLGNLPAYDIAPDDGRLVMLAPAARPQTICVLTGWRAAIFPPDAE